MILTYDGTYNGLLSVIFETYRVKITPQQILPAEEWQGGLFDDPIYVETRLDWAERVRKGVAKKTSEQAANMLYRCFLSELLDIEMLIYRFVRLAIASEENIAENYREDFILKLHQINKKIGREVHRMHAFVRFQRTKDDIYYAVVEPDFDVLPLIGTHFEERYPAQQWLIYDSKRHYGIYYDERKITYITFDSENHTRLKQLSKDILNENEPDYQVLWKSYFDSVNIPERRNMKLHLQHVPKRYWKYLVEKS